MAVDAVVSAETGGAVCACPETFRVRSVQLDWSPRRSPTDLSALQLLEVFAICDVMILFMLLDCSCDFTKDEGYEHLIRDSAHSITASHASSADL